MHKDILQYVSRETYALLEHYVEILMHWNHKISLISRKLTKEEVWQDHILDSLILNDFLTERDKSLVDVGSGAGFPGLILAINNYSKCCLVEKNNKKANFLKKVSADLGLKIDIRNECISQVSSIKPRYITSRAMSSIKDILNLTKNLINSETEYLLHIGENSDQISELKKFWHFKLREWPNPYKKKCSIISISSVVRREE